jgi:hypothetical protein
MRALRRGAAFGLLSAQAAGTALPARARARPALQLLLCGPWLPVAGDAAVTALPRPQSLSRRHRGAGGDPAPRRTGVCEHKPNPDRYIERAGNPAINNDGSLTHRSAYRNIVRNSTATSRPAVPRCAAVPLCRRAAVPPSRRPACGFGRGAPDGARWRSVRNLHHPCFIGRWRWPHRWQRPARSAYAHREPSTVVGRPGYPRPAHACGYCNHVKPIDRA